MLIIIYIQTRASVNDRTHEIHKSVFLWQIILINTRITETGKNVTSKYLYCRGPRLSIIFQAAGPPPGYNFPLMRLNFGQLDIIAEWSVDFHFYARIEKCRLLIINDDSLYQSKQLLIRRTSVLFTEMKSLKS